jgi:hypothetical protein
VASGTYLLSPAGTGTRVTFVYAWERAPLGERIAAPLVRRMLRAPLQTSLARLGEALAQQAASDR